MKTKMIALITLGFVFFAKAQIQVSLDKQIKIHDETANIMVNVADINNDQKNEIVCASCNSSGSLFYIIYEGKIQHTMKTTYTNIRNVVVIQDSLIGFVHGDSFKAINPYDSTFVFSAYSGSSTDGIAKGDFNNDGYIDVVCSNWNSPYLRVFLNSESGFNQGKIIDIPAVDAGYNQVKVYDIDNNGRDDIIFLAGQGSFSGVYVYLNTKENLFKNMPYYLELKSDVKLNPTNMIFGNFFGSGKGLLVNESWGGKSVFLQYEDGWTSSVINNMGLYTPSVSKLSLDSLDQAVYISTSNKLTIFNPLTSFDIQGGNYHAYNQLLSTGDIDGDGLAEIVQASDYGTINIFKVKKTQPTTAIHEKQAQEYKITSTNGYIHIESPEKNYIRVFTLQGCEIFSQQTDNIHIQVNPGIYIIKIKDEAKKIIVH